MGDITKGETFVDGQQCTAARLNNLLDGASINTYFHTSRSSVSSNPSKTNTEILVYDASAAAWKKGSLSALFFDSTELISGRSAKTTPVSADVFLLGDSAASYAFKQISLSNLLFGAAAHSAPIAGDKVPIYDSSGALTKTITLANLINALVAHTAPVTADELMLRENGGAVRKMTLGNLVNGATALTVPAAGHFIPVYDGAYKKIDLKDLINGLASSLTSPAGTELLQVLDGSTLKKMLLSDWQAYLGNNYVLVREEQTATTSGGTFTSGAWQTRQLSAERSDAAGISSFAGSQVTLAAGTYYFRGEAVGYLVGSHQVRLQNVTDAATLGLGLTAYTNASTQMSLATVTGRFTIAAGKALELQHQCETTRSTDGFGKANSWGTNIYATLEFWKVA